jgi:hypothetical protein
MQTPNKSVYLSDKMHLKKVLNQNKISSLYKKGPFITYIVKVNFDSKYLFLGAF